MRLLLIILLVVMSSVFFLLPFIPMSRDLERVELVEGKDFVILKGEKGSLKLEVDEMVLAKTYSSSNPYDFFSELIDPSFIGFVILGDVSMETATYIGIIILSALLGFFEGWNFVAWETLIADSCPPQMAGFTFQYGMTGTHFSAFLVASISGYLLDYSHQLAILAALAITSIGFLAVKFAHPFETSKIRVYGGE